MVVYSATKHIDGQGRVLGGAILGAHALMDEAYKDILRHTGPALSPFNAWVLLKGLETLELRVRAPDRHRRRRWPTGSRPTPRSSASPTPSAPTTRSSAVANQMSGGGTILAFDLGSARRGLRLPQRAGDRRHLQQPGRRQVDGHPPLHHHPPRRAGGGAAEIGLTEGWVRLTVGLEDEGDLARDLERALDAA